MQFVFDVGFAAKTGMDAEIFPFCTLQAGSATNDTSVGWLCTVFETGDASVERNVAEMGCFRPTVVPTVARVLGVGLTVVPVVAGNEWEL